MKIFDKNRLISFILAFCILCTVLSGLTLTAFAAGDSYTVKFSVPEGITAPESVTVTAGKNISLPMGLASPNGKYRFAGWSVSRIVGELSNVTVLTGSYTPTMSGTLYAVYSVSSGNDNYEKVTSEPATWDGQYLIVCEASSIAFNANKGNTLATLNVVNNYLSVKISSGKIEASDDLDKASVTIAQADSGNYTIKLPCNKYLGFTGSSTSGMNVNEKTAYEHTVAIKNGIVTIQNASGKNIRTFVYNSKYNKFAYYNEDSNISLYKKNTSETKYATDVPACEHVYNLTNTVNATCTTDTVNTYTCSVCTLSYTETVANTALGHTPNGEPTVIAAKCTVDGSRTFVCANCGETVTEKIPAAGHIYVNGICTVCGEKGRVFTKITAAEDITDGNYVLVVYGAKKPGWYALRQSASVDNFVDAAKVDALFDSEEAPDAVMLSESEVIWTLTVTDDTFTLNGDDGSKLNTTTDNDLYYNNGETDAAIDWKATANNNGTFKLTATDTDNKARALGIRDELTTTMADGTPLFRCNLSANASGSSYQFYLYREGGEIPEDDTELRIQTATLRLDEDIDVVYTASVPKGYTDVSVTFTMNGKSVNVPDDGTHTFVFEGVNPQCMGDNISAVLTASCGGTTYTCTQPNYSVRSYCVNTLARTDISPEIRTLVSDLLAYGAAAQTFVNYKTTELVTSGAINNPTYSTYTDLSGLSATFTGTAANDLLWVGTGLTLTNDVAMNFRFYAESVDGLSIKVSISGREETFTKFTAVAGKDKVYEISFAGIKATEYADHVQASFCRNGAQVGNTVSYSVNAYVCAKQADSSTALANLVKALYNYGKSIRAFSD